FGAKRLPEIGASLGKGIREFKGSVREIEREINAPEPSESETLGAGSDAPSARGEEREAPEAGEAGGEEREREEAESSSRLTPDG
ncbi:MAG: hypothetical protein GWM92_13130, partial [Gemmatimonadetes bacterium]|nr:hypothetical protein [Gemmatimonadota bacterium]NIR79640.1 hypothetical protein [Gemmatimonadota bacterium]NIT88340.1 hypothetical protein [Gemmatimonadota bacterium]NIU32149.1 hypothetical protein [Gemmatimonadota bacterium]NIU36717.1 hypothetical protein [Gemmatimonadota bacterium]